MNSYTKTTWVDNNTPALNAENLNHIEQGIKNVTDEVIGGTLHVVDVPFTAENNADSCVEPNTLYYVYVKAYDTTGVQNTKQYVMCTPDWYGVKTQYGFTKQGKIIFRSCNNDVWEDWAVLATTSDVSTAVSGKANAADVVDKTTYNADLSEIDEQLMQMEDIANKVTQITGNETASDYPTALAVKFYVDAAIAAALNG